MIRIRIRSAHEEGQCADCGCPSFIGDEVYESHRQVFCSKTCAANHFERTKPNEDDRQTGRRVCSGPPTD